MLPAPPALALQNAIRRCKSILMDS
jgi:hypothetical protein